MGWALECSYSFKFGGNYSNPSSDS